MTCPNPFLENEDRAVDQPADEIAETKPETDEEPDYWDTMIFPI